MTPTDRIREEERARDAALAGLAALQPFAAALGARFERMGDEVTARLVFSPDLIGNPLLPALHGGAIGAFLETTALLQLGWERVWRDLEASRADRGEDGQAAARRADVLAGRFPPLPKTIDLTVDYLRSARPRDLFARAIVTKRGRRVANVRIEAWQDVRDKPVAAAHGHFLASEDDDDALEAAAAERTP